VHDVIMQDSRIIGVPWAGAAALVLWILLSPSAFARHHSHAAPAAGAPGHFDYYLLTLSWSPSYCLLHPGDRYQCQGRGFGFVLHGLWPQFNSGGYPEGCASNVDLDGEAEAVGRTLYPSPELMRHEWQRHGTCSGLDAAEYFRTADRALAVLHVPARFEAPRADQRLAPDQILEAFRVANPNLPPHAMTVACNRAALSEVRLCLTQNLLPRPCGHGVSDSCPSVPILVRSVR
jgi:ribonuclease T2